jgi:pyridoxal 5'-phosphate synthase pdxS subunit
MLKGGVIMDVTNAEQAKIAEDAGAVAVMALERVPSDIRKDGGVARMSPVKKIQEIQKTVTIPVMAKCRIGHFVEAQILESLGVDFIDESEVLTPADEHFHVDKFAFKVPFVCGCRDLGEALRRIGEGAPMIRTKGEAGSGNIVESVRHMHAVSGRRPRARRRGDDDGPRTSARLRAVRWIAKAGHLPVPNLRRRHHDARAALMMQLGAQAVFVGSASSSRKIPRCVPGVVRRRVQGPRRAREVRRISGTPCRYRTSRLRESDLLQIAAGRSGWTDERPLLPAGLPVPVDTGAADHLRNRSARRRCHRRRAGTASTGRQRS